MTINWNKPLIFKNWDKKIIASFKYESCPDGSNTYIVKTEDGELYRYFENGNYFGGNDEKLIIKNKEAEKIWRLMISMGIYIEFFAFHIMELGKYNDN